MAWWRRRFRRHNLKVYSQVLRQMVILMSIEMNSSRYQCRKSKRIISRNNNWKIWRRRSIVIKRNQRGIS